MTQEALKLALEFIEDVNFGEWRGSTERQERVITAIKEALAQLEQEYESVLIDGVAYTIPSKVAVEILGLHLDLLQLKQEQEPVGDEWTPCMKLPVVVYVRKQRLGESHVSTREGITPVKPDDLIMRGVSGEEYPIGRAIFERTYSLNTTPPQRTWVGLTDTEIDAIYTGVRAVHREIDSDVFARAIESKLKEVNT